MLAETALVKESLEKFSTYAVIDPPCVPIGRWSAMQVMLTRWEIREVGYQPFDRPMFGVIEEIGELVEALEGNEQFRQFSIYDAMADICAYTMQVCTHFRLDFGTIVDNAKSWSGTTKPFTVQRCGRLAHLALKHAQRARGMGDVMVMRTQLVIEFTAICSGLLYLGNTNSDGLYNIVEPYLNNVLARVNYRGMPMTVSTHK